LHFKLVPMTLMSGFQICPITYTKSRRVSPVPHSFFSFVPVRSSASRLIFSKPPTPPVFELRNHFRVPHFFFLFALPLLFRREFQLGKVCRRSCSSVRPRIWLLSPASRIQFRVGFCFSPPLQTASRRYLPQSSFDLAMTPKLADLHPNGSLLFCLRFRESPTQPISLGVHISDSFPS